MLTSLKLHNFKCFEDLELSLCNLNVFTGMNGAGKSTILQSLLLLAQSADSIENTGKIRLNGSFEELGVGSDILYEKAVSDDIEISYRYDGEAFSYQMHNSAADEIQTITGEKAERPFKDTHIIYLSAYRIAPQKLYHITDENMLCNREFDKSGEYVIQYLDRFRNDDVKNQNILRGTDRDRSLGKQTDYWMDLISPGVRPEIYINDLARTAELRFSYKKGRDLTNAYRSINVGFGITYVLPVVVSLLTAQPGDIIILENPEAHIHPKGQRMLGEMIAAASASGAQIMVETHSDHVLNGIRLAVKNRVIRCDTVKLYYLFQKDDANDAEENYTHECVSPIIDEDGMLNEWPEGFFDEWDNALMELLS